MRYPGGKNAEGVYHRIINQITPHRVYIEPFLGSGKILRSLRPAEISIGIDIDAQVVEEFRSDHPSVKVACGDGIGFLRIYPFRGDEFVYLDPPYLIETRKAKARIYRHELTKTQHMELLSIITELPCPVMISGYRSKLYREALKGWRTMTYAAMTRGGRSTEVLWMNYPEPTELHDYRFLGEDYRERENIRRQQKRWVEGLLRLGKLRRAALLNELREVENKK